MKTVKVTKSKKTSKRVAGYAGAFLSKVDDCKGTEGVFVKNGNGYSKVGTVNQLQAVAASCLAQKEG